MKQNKTLVFLPCIVILMVILMSAMKIGNVLELKIMDWQFLIRGEKPIKDDVFVVAIGDESVSPEAVGRWPWRRVYMAILIDILRSYGPKTMIYDILFTEPSEGELAGDDITFAEQAEISGNVYFPFFCIPESTEKIRGYRKTLDPVNLKLIGRISVGKASDYVSADFIKAKRLVMPIPLLSGTARGSGYVNAMPDVDGVTRRIPLIMQYDDYLVPNVAFYAAIRYMGFEEKDIIIKPGRYIMLSNGKKTVKIPVDKKCQMLVNHAGPFRPGIMPMAPYVGIVEAFDDMSAGRKPKVDLAGLKDQLVFVGLTATGTADLRPTPFTPLFPMVGFLASASANIINGQFLRSAPGWLNYLLIVITGLAASLFTIRLRAVSSALLNTGVVAAYFLGSYLLFKSNCVITTFYPFLAVVLSYTTITMYRFTAEEKEKKVIRGIFQRYVSSRVVDVLLEHPEQIKLGGERKRLTVFFSDIRGFTSMSEKLQPEEVVSILNEYLTEMIDIIFKHGGTLDKFIGDAVMAIWGAPMEQKNHAELAVKAAWEMKQKVKELQEKWASEGKEHIIRVGMGVNTGDVVVGNMGSSQFSDYTVIGDNVNLAARLEENAKGGELIISESTYEEVSDIVEAKKLEPLKVKGKEKPVKVYEITGIKI
ncbi:MAG: adenylate/guanylate cyclase domain-containing protein [Elusimicrobia bacterium]|nr:adenylate/guanylate cyclase domain-containing protein [Elusimicrobiota bacterium]